MRVEAPLTPEFSKHHLHLPCWYISKKADTNYFFLLINCNKRGKARFMCKLNPHGLKTKKQKPQA